MIRLPEDDKKIDHNLNEALATPSSAQPSEHPLTATSSSTVSSLPSNDNQLQVAENDRLLIDFGDAPRNADESLGLGPPPDFTPYEAQYFEVGYSDVVSHDPHLNSDGEALYRFLLSQATSSPSHRISCRGTHSESRYRWVTERDTNGHSRSRQETYTETVVDFDFCIDIVPNSPVDPVQWSVADDEPAYRGLMVREFEGSVGTGRGVAKGQKLKDYKKWVEKRNGLGLPPWVREMDTDITDGSIVHLVSLRSSKTLRQWADEYCASPKYLKEFVYKKVLYGWNMQQIESAIRSTIKSTPYNGSLQINFTPYGSKVYIRPNNAVSRMLSNKWLKFLSIILLIFPFIWLFKRFHSRGGGRWEVCGGAYPLKQWVPLEPGEEIHSDPLPPYNPISTNSALTTTSQSVQRSSRYMQTPTGPKKLLGIKEGEWFRNWEDVIIRAVIGRYQSPVPLASRGVSSLPVRSLDGYDEALLQF
ncbi:hypothetical protein BYT27DRAFT_7164905 [Phlegmacium glaucopus]|nr:hypothetical protein BYT27DRAFT_7164905 [Phlegmacium glaucopus]